MLQRPATGTIPDAPGSYQFKDAQGRVLYVGKAKSLRSRLSNYFAPPDTLMPRTRQMVASRGDRRVDRGAQRGRGAVPRVQPHQAPPPRFNIRYKDDKSYPYLAVTLDEEWPRAMVLRGAKRKGVRYFGPYAHAYAIRETLDLLLRTFPIRTCTQTKFDRHHRLGRPCLYAHIEKCAAPCVGDIDHEEYDALVAELLAFLDGEHAPVLDRLDKQMHEASDALEFERAARLRDQLFSVRKAIERQQMVARQGGGLRRHRPRGGPDRGVGAGVLRAARPCRRAAGASSSTRWRTSTRPSSSASSLEQLYGDAAPDDVPREVLVPVATRGRRALRGVPRSRCAASKVRVRVPQRGNKRELLATVTHNAQEAFTQHKLSGASDHNARARALTALQEALDLPEAPLRIECFDISNLQGTEIVGVDGGDGGRPGEALRLPAVQDPSPGGPGRLRGDGGGAHPPLPPLPRRARRGRPGREALLVPAQPACWSTAARASSASRCGCSRSSGLEDIAVASLAKRFEEVYRPGRAEPIRIPRDSEALYLLQQVRDEAHRFAITYHRQLREQAGDRVDARRRARPRPGAPHPPAARVRLGEAAARADRGRAGRDPVAARDRGAGRLLQAAHG